MGETLNKSIQKSTDLQDPFLKYLSLEIGKLERHQERVSGFETAIRLEVTLRDKWKTRAKNYGQLKKGINIVVASVSCFSNIPHSHTRIAT